MPQLTALSLSIAILGAVWAALALGPLAGFVLVWAGFIAWGCYFHTGADNKALTKTIVGNAYGVVIAWIALLIIVNVSIAALGVIWPAVVVGVTVFLLVIVASYEPLSAVPANVYGYAATVAYSLHQPSQAGAGPLENLTAASFENPLPLLIVSMVLGAMTFLGASPGAPNIACSRSDCSILVGRPVEGPPRCTSTITSGVSVITASPWNSVLSAMPGPEVIVSAVCPA